MPPKAHHIAFFPHLRQAVLDDPEVFDDLHVDCNICYREIPLNPLPVEIEMAEKDCEDALDVRVLICGHMFCRPCISQWVECCRTGGGMPCPVCRQGSSTRRKNTPYQLYGVEEVIMAPKCLSEGGAFPETFFYNVYEMALEILPSILADSLQRIGAMPVERIESFRNGPSQVNNECTTKIVVLVQLSWGYSEAFALQDGRIKKKWEGESAGLTVKEQRIEVEHDNAFPELSPPFTFPLFAREDEDGAISQVMRRENNNRDEVWAPKTVGLGVGICDCFCPDDRVHLTEAMTDPDCVKEIANMLGPLMRKQGQRESVSTLLT